MTRGIPIAVLVLAGVASLSGCEFEGLDLSDRGCPCGIGWVCDEPRDLCVQRLTSDSGLDSGTDSGLDSSTDSGTDSGSCETPIPPPAEVEMHTGKLMLRNFGCFIDDGQLFCFGRGNGEGQLGSGVTDCAENGCKSEVIHPDGKRWDQVAIGSQHGCAVDEDGVLWCWGDNSDFQLGRPGSDPGVARSVEFPVTRVNASSSGTCAIKRNTRTLHCWGEDSSGQSGVLVDGVCANGPGMNIEAVGRIASSTIEACPPITDDPELGRWVNIVGTSDTACGHLEDGRAYCWGGTVHGTTGRDEVVCLPGCRPNALAGQWQKLSTGMLHHRCGIRPDNTLICWGRNRSGQLGVGYASVDATDEISVCDPAPGDRGAEVLLSESVPVAHPTGGVWVDVSAGFFTTCALDATNQVYCWGGNFGGSLGPGAPEQSLEPRLVELPDGVVPVEVSAGHEISCVMTADAAVYCWGARALRCAGATDCSRIFQVH